MTHRLDTIRIGLCLALGFLFAGGVPALAQVVSLLPPFHTTHNHGLDAMADHVVRLPWPLVDVAGKRASSTYVSGVVAEVFNGVVLHGASSDKALTGKIRFDDGSGWANWEDLYIVPSATDAAFMAAYRGTRFRENVRFELVFDYDAEASLRLNGAGVFDNRKDEDAQASAEPLAFSPRIQGRESLIIPPVVHRRSDWGAEAFRGDPIPLARPTYDFITFHHAAGFNAETFEEGRAQVKAIQDFHQNGRGWSDIGYHFVLDRSGNIFQGRPFLNEQVDFRDGPVLAQGAHAGGANTGNIGICLLGCYHPPEGGHCAQEITPAALDSLVTLMAFLSETYDVSPTRVRGHRDFGSTACPGDNNYALLDDIRASVAQLLLTGNEAVGQATLAVVADEQGVVEVQGVFLQDQGITSYVIERIVRDRTTVVYEADRVESFSFADIELTTTGTVSYRLIAWRGSREQVLATATIDVERPRGSVLAESFPNPFQQETTIRFFLDQPGIVTLEVFDALGRTVETLVDEYLEAGVWYPVQFEASALASGTYYYRIQVEGFSGVAYEDTQPLVLVR